MERKKFKKILGTCAITMVLAVGVTLGEKSAKAEDSELHPVVSSNFKIDQTLIEKYVDIYVTGVEGASAHKTDRGYEILLDLDEVYEAYKDSDVSLTDQYGITGVISNYDLFKSYLGDKLNIVMKTEMEDGTMKAKMYVDILGNLEFASSIDLSAIGKDEKKETVQSLRKEPLFSDIDRHFAKYEIEKLYQFGIVNGLDEQNFNPNGTVSRAQFATMLYRTLSGADISYIKSLGNVSLFKDMENNWAIEEVSALYLMGVIEGTTIKGTNDKVFEPNKPINRQQAAVMIDRFLDAIGKAPKVQTAIPFKDAGEISNYARTGVEKLYSMGVISGKDSNLFDPFGQLTRGELAKILWGVLSYDYESSQDVLQ